MPTVPPGQLVPPAPPMTELHQHRQLAESFGTDTDRYDRARPRYPAALIDRIVATAPGRRILDVGCGTGIAARQFQAAGCAVLGVEPDQRMADFSQRSGVETEVATFETWDPAGREFDAVAAGQAWHWVDPVAGAARAAQVLRPGGLLALFWNSFQPAPEVAEAFAAVYGRALPDAPVNAWSPAALAGHTMLASRAADGIRAAGRFSEPQSWQFGWEMAYTTAEWLDQLPTHGDKTRLPPGQLAELLAGFGTVIDAMGGRFVMPYITVFVAALRAG